MQHTLDQLFATHCAPALTGVAPANLISLRRGDVPHLEEELRKYHRAFACRGVCFHTLCSCPGHELILVYRPRLIRQTLERAGVEELLTPWGYDLTRPVEEILAHLGQRVRQGGSFPHEIGVFLGYPLEDVVGFIENRGRNYTCCGCWKAYGDPEAARRRFEQYRRCTADCQERFRQGAGITQLIAA